MLGVVVLVGRTAATDTWTVTMVHLNTVFLLMSHSINLFRIYSGLCFWKYHLVIKVTYCTYVFIQLLNYVDIYCKNKSAQGSTEIYKYG